MKYILSTEADGTFSKMYFTGTKWGPGYFNGIHEAYLFDTYAQALEAKKLLEEEFEGRVEHNIEEYEEVK